VKNGFADHDGMKRFWSFEETRRNGTDVSQFRGKAAGSNPASPTIKTS